MIHLKYYCPQYYCPQYYCPQYYCSQYCPQNSAPYHTSWPHVLCAMPEANRGYSAPYHTSWPHVLCAMPETTRSTCIDHCSNANNILCAAFESVNEHFHADTTIKGHAVALLATTVMSCDRVDSSRADYPTELILSAFHVLSS